MEIYSPEEDSLFLSQILKKEIPKLQNSSKNGNFVSRKSKKNKDFLGIKQFKKLKYLEIGPGSGIQLQTLVSLKIPKSNLYSADINPAAVLHCKNLGFHCIRSNLFSKIKGKYNVIIFNPPYLPQNKFDKKPDTTGGKIGSEVINKFLKQAASFLEKDGKIILLTSSFTGKINWQNFKKRLIAEKSLFFEKLYIWEITI